MDDNIITQLIIKSAIEVHKILGPGMLESAYKKALIFELCLNKLKVKSEVPIPIIYKNINIDCGYRADLIVEDRILIELKAQEDKYEVFAAQVLTNTKLAGYKIGLLINFYHKKLVTGIKRFIF